MWNICDVEVHGKVGAMLWWRRSDVSGYCICQLFLAAAASDGLVSNDVE